MTPAGCGRCSNGAAARSGALAGLERGLASAVLCERASADELPARAVAGPHLAGGGALRPGPPAPGGAAHPRVRRRTTGLSDRRVIPRPPGGAARRGRRRRRPLTRRRVAMVGTRAATPHGLADARDLGAVLARAAITVVSGLAIGIDAAVHEGALDAGGCGRRRARHRARRRVPAPAPRVVRSCARLRSAGERARVRHATATATSFPVRNRIIAGLAELVVVVEATLKGGARITAERATRVRPHGDGLPGVTPQPVGRGHELVAVRRRVGGPRAGRRAGPARVRPTRAATRPAPSTDAATQPRCSRPATASRRRSTSSRAGAGSRRRRWSRRCGSSSGQGGCNAPGDCAGPDERERAIPR